MEITKNFLRIDFWIQTVLGIIILLTVWFLIGFLFLIPFGAWQVISSIIIIIYCQDRRRIWYLTSTIAFGMAMYLLGDSYETSDIVDALTFICVPALAIWYYVMTYQDYIKYVKSEINSPQ